ncbi:hypothetical protein CRE_10435 [Caenorhabditis remanei]|uniref:Uncharacterized protein n=1 Tax=Caenorhabditis remanei TaxID=31234 RepID=E3N0V7_CAERE|nr:hypothetical protein CRE_10435 [Caenorhabditis remanei]
MASRRIPKRRQCTPKRVQTINQPPRYRFQGSQVPKSAPGTCDEGIHLLTCNSHWARIDRGNNQQEDVKE